MENNIRGISEIYKHKKTKTVVFLGCGSSINDIKEDQWDILLDFDTFAVNNWNYHPTIPPKFYSVEVKKYDFDFFVNNLDNKRSLYKDTIFIVQDNFTFCHSYISAEMAVFVSTLKSTAGQTLRLIFL